MMTSIYWGDYMITADVVPGTTRTAGPNPTEVREIEITDRDGSGLDYISWIRDQIVSTGRTAESLDAEIIMRLLQESRRPPGGW